MKRRAFVAGLALALTGCTQASQSAVGNPCDAAQSTANFPPDAGATLLRIEGLVLRPDGTTPAADVIVYAYQTGAAGSYDTDSNGRPRRDTFMRTNSEGRFVLNTSMPGAYPNGREAAHVHLQLWGGGAPAQWAEDVLFAEDPLLSEATRQRSAAAGRFAWVSEPRTEEGVRVVERVIQLKPQGDRFERVTRHGLDVCRVDAPG